MQDIHSLTPGMAIELADVSKNGEPGQHSVSLPLDERALTIRVDFDGTHGNMSHKESSQDAPSSPCK